MIPLKRLAAAFALGAGLAAAGAALAQTPNDSAAAGAAAQPASSPPAQSTTFPTDPTDPGAQRVYSVPPPDGSSDRDLPTAVGGYARSVAGCVVLGCDDEPQFGDPPGPLAPRPDETPPPPPVNAQPDQPR
jgi:hypothetical protein